MGCAHSIPDNHPSLFKARNLNDKDKAVNSVVIEVQSSKVIVRTLGGKVMASWPIACLRRYGCNRDILFIEAGSGCETGHGMYLFKCARTEQIFDLLKQHWNELQSQQEAFGPHNMGFPQVPSQTVISTTNQNQEYYNMTQPNGTPRLTSNGSNNAANYTNGSVRVPSASSTPIPPITPIPRGSTSSQHGSTLAALPEEMPLRLEVSEQPFTLQPAPTSRKEMKNRQRINSDMTVASYSRQADRVTIATPQRRNSENANYENREATSVQSSSFARSHNVSYNIKTQKVKVEPTRANTTSANLEGDQNNPAALSPDTITSHDVSTVSLRSDCEPLLTPGSKSSGIGSLNGNGNNLTSQVPPSLPPPISDPWKPQPHFKLARHHFSPLYVPQSARDYVNTANASMDVSGTPLPSTAVGRMHFDFDFVTSGFSLRHRSGESDRGRQLNYVHVEAFKNGDDFNCGASSASSGIPGTPRTPKTPKTPLTCHPATDYAIIDHNKTRALSNTHRARQRQRKSRHGSTEVTLMNAV